jgi:hypothetical protein
MAETVTELASKLNGIYGTQLTESLLEVATAAEDRLAELETCQVCENAATYHRCTKHAQR